MFFLYIYLHIIATNLTFFEYNFANDKFAKGMGIIKRIAVISIIVDDSEKTNEVNSLLHEYAGIIEGRMGLPMKQYLTSIITVVVAAENKDISALSGKLGRIPGINVKASYSSKEFE